jgi:hypothetical protein
MAIESITRVVNLFMVISQYWSQQLAQVAHTRLIPDSNPGGPITHFGLA